MKYVVEVNRCGCHPETCCCDPWRVVDSNDKLFSTFYSKDVAIITADLLNRDNHEKQSNGSQSSSL